MKASFIAITCAALAVSTLGACATSGSSLSTGASSFDARDPDQGSPRQGLEGDRDWDGIPDGFDRDRDGDGVPNRLDSRPNDRRWRE